MPVYLQTIWQPGIYWINLAFKKLQRKSASTNAKRFSRNNSVSCLNCYGLDC